MKTLIKIRATYLKKHPCESFCSYLFVGLIMLISGIIAIVNQINKYIIFGVAVIEQKNSNQIYETKSYLFNIGLISEDDQIIESFKQLSKSYPNLNLSYFNEDIEINKFNQFSGIIEIKNLNNTYQINIKRRKSTFFVNIINEYLKYPSSEIIENFLTNITNRFLLDYLNNTNSKSFNINPIILKGSDYIDESIIYIYGSIYIFMYGIFFFSFALRMIDEREKKLDSLLNRYGIKKYQYFFSWFLTYLAITAFSTISSLFCLFTIILDDFTVRFFLIVFSHILYSIGIFVMSFFIQSIIKTIKTGQILFRVLFIGITIIGLILIFKNNIPKILKIFMCIFPHLSQFVALIALGTDEEVGHVKFGIIESIVYQILDIVFYTFGGFFIMEYQESGVGFFDFMMSLCKEKKKSN